MTQGERVREVRKFLGLTLEKFGENLGVGKGAISKIEKDQVSLTDQMVKSICREYNVNYDYLIYGEEPMFSDLPQTILDELCLQYGLDDFDKAVVKAYISLPPEFRQVVKSKMKEFLSEVDFDA